MTTKAKAMNKADLVALMAETSGFSKAEAERALNLVTESVIKAISKGHGINLVGFGSFVIQERAPRDGRNPKTGEKMHIEGYYHTAFRAGKKLKKASNPHKD